MCGGLGRQVSRAAAGDPMDEAESSCTCDCDIEARRILTFLTAAHGHQMEQEWSVHAYCVGRRETRWMALDLRTRENRQAVGVLMVLNTRSLY